MGRCGARIGSPIRIGWRPQVNRPANGSEGTRASSSGGPSSGSSGGGPHVPPGFVLRQGRPTDLPAIVGFVWSERMNPLGIEPARFTIAIATAAEAATGAAASGSSGSGGVAGVVQTVPLGGGDGAAGGGRAGEVAPGAVELRTLVVAPAHRGCGLGSGLVRQRLSALPAGTPVWLTTVASRAPFYQRLGFAQRALAEAPREMYFEVAAGVVAARLLANQQLVVMSTVVGRA